MVRARLRTFRARRPAGKRVLLERVEIFHTGTFREGTEEEGTYTDADLSDIVINFAVLRSGVRPVLIPPVGVGHEKEEEALYSRSDPLSYGEIVRLWTEPGELDGRPVTFLCAAMRVDPELAQWIESGNLTRVSSEIYDEPPEGATAARGRVLKRLALLGFELPQLKGLVPLPLPAAAAERPADKRRVAVAAGEGPLWVKLSRAGLKKVVGKHYAYSECRAIRHYRGGRPVEREQKVAAIIKFYKLPQAFVDALDDKQLDELVGLILAGGGAGTEGAGASEHADPATMTRDQLIAELTAMGQDPAQLDAMTDDQLRELYARLAAEATANSETGAGAGGNGAGGGGGTGNPPTPAPVPALPAALVAQLAQTPSLAALATLPQQINRAFSEGQRLIQRERASYFAERQRARLEDKRKRVREFVEAGRVARFITPAMLDKGKDGRNYTVEDELMDADDTRVIRSYTEAGKAVKKTQLDLLMDKYRAGAKPRVFTEEIAQPADGTTSRFEQLREQARARHAAGKKQGKTLETKLGLLPARALR